MRDEFTLPRLPFFSQGLMKDYSDLDFLPSLYAMLLSQPVGPYTSVPQEHFDDKWSDR